MPEKVYARIWPLLEISSVKSALPKKGREIHELVSKFRGYRVNRTFLMRHNEAVFDTSIVTFLVTLYGLRRACACRVYHYIEHA